MDDWGWNYLQQWLDIRETLPRGQVFCVLTGPTAGRTMQGSDVRRQVKEASERAGIRKHTHCHGLRHTHAVELWREGVDILAIQQQLGHVRLDTTTIYLGGLTMAEILKPISVRKPPMMIVGF